MLATGFPFRELCSIWLGIPREQSSTLYIVVTVGEVVEVGCGAAGRAAGVGWLQ